MFSIELWLYNALFRAANSSLSAVSRLLWNVKFLVVGDCQRAVLLLNNVGPFLLLTGTQLQTLPLSGFTFDWHLGCQWETTLQSSRKICIKMICWLRKWEVEKQDQLMNLESIHQINIMNGELSWRYFLLLHSLLASLSHPSFAKHYSSSCPLTPFIFFSLVICSPLVFSPFHLFLFISFFCLCSYSHAPSLSHSSPPLSCSICLEGTLRCPPVRHQGWKLIWLLWSHPKHFEFHPIANYSANLPGTPLNVVLNAPRRYKLCQSG